MVVVVVITCVSRVDGITNITAIKTQRIADRQPQTYTHRQASTQR